MADFSFNIYAVVLLLTLIHAMVFGIIIFVRGISHNFYSDKWLGLLVTILGLSAIPHLFGWMGIDILWNRFTFYPWNGLELAVLPTAFLYLQSRLNSRWRFRWTDLKYYSLYIVFFVYHLTIAIQGKDYARWWWFDVNNRFNIDALFSFCNLILFAFFLKKLDTSFKAYQTWSANRFSNLSLLSVSWIRNFLIAYFIFLLVDGGLTILKLTIGPQYDKMWWAYLANLALTYYISIYGLYTRPPLDIQFDLSKTILNEAPTPKTQTDASTPDTDIQLWKEKIKTHIESTQAFINPELRLSEIATHLSINVSQLSTLINACFGQNFNDLINSYRIEAFIQKVKAGQLSTQTIMGLAYDSGFNAKTTFNRAFKKHTGSSPSAYLKNLDFPGEMGAE
jgi:AraC-like DNA-binding protein